MNSYKKEAGEKKSGVRKKIGRAITFHTQMYGTSQMKGPRDGKAKAFYHLPLYLTNDNASEGLIFTLYKETCIDRK